MCPTGTSRVPRTKKKSSNLHTAFQVLDVDQDGKISSDDLRAFYVGFKGAGMSSGEDVVGSLIMVADSNKDGYVEYDEFEKVLGCRNNDKVKNGRWSLMQDVFRVMDKDGDGKIGLQDLKSYLGCAGFDASDDDIKAMIKLGGGHENGGVTFEALLKILAI